MNGTMSINELLAQQNEAYQKAETSGDYSPVPAGDYVLKICEVIIKAQKRKDGTTPLKLNWKFRVESSINNGKKIYISTDLEGDFIWVTKTYLEKCGKVLSDFAELPGILESSELIGLQFNATVTVKGDYNRIQLNELITPKDFNEEIAEDRSDAI